MKICVISKEDGRGGGASVVAEQLVLSYRYHGHQAEHYHFGETSNINPYGTFKPVIKLLKRIESKRGFREHVPFELISNVIRKIPKEFDVIHIHDTSSVISHQTVRWLANHAPTIWTIHDCSVFTAGCLYPYSCDKFVNLCHDCPQLGSWPLNVKIDRTRELHAARKKVTQSRVLFTAPSIWMRDQFIRAGWPASRIELVSNGVDTSVFKPYDRDQILAEFGIPKPDGPLILFSAGFLDDTRCGSYTSRRNRTVTISQQDETRYYS